MELEVEPEPEFDEEPSTTPEPEPQDEHPPFCPPLLDTPPILDDTLEPEPTP